jgi:hypothetical protein
VTLTGPGGSGKTRLAIEAAASLVPDYDAGVFWVELAALQDPGLVPEAISKSVGARNGLAEHIGVRELLVLLDNLEQVIAAASELSELLAACPNLRSGSVICARRSPMPSWRSPILTRERSTTPPVWRSLGESARRSGDEARAGGCFRDALRSFAALGDGGVADCLDGLSRLAAARDTGRAGRLRGAAQQLREARGRRRSAPMYRSRTYRTPRWPRGVR